MAFIDLFGSSWQYTASFVAAVMWLVLGSISKNCDDRAPTDKSRSFFINANIAAAVVAVVVVGYFTAQAIS
jgi:hypothetical protein